MGIGVGEAVLLRDDEMDDQSHCSNLQSAMSRDNATNELPRTSPPRSGAKVRAYDDEHDEPAQGEHDADLGDVPRGGPHHAELLAESLA